MKICIFPNDPIISYYEKGEIKKRYFNPDNFFDHIDIISFSDNEIEESKVQSLVGNAKLKIHCVGKISIKNRTKKLQNIKKLVKNLNPDIIRAYNPLIQGWFAASCAKELKIPFFVSLHTQYDYNRTLVRKSNLKKYLSLKYSEKFIVPFVLDAADKITAVYKIIEPYVLKHSSKKPEILYNKVEHEQFSKYNKIESLPTPLIISVGNLIEVKNHQCLIEAMKEIDAHLLIIGKGELYEDITHLIKKFKMEEKITIIESVQHNQIQDYYRSAQFFALAYNPEVEGLPMPVMEAMASGLPVVIPYPKKGYSEGLEDVAIFSELNPKSFSNNFQRLLKDERLRNEYAEKSIKKARDFDSKKIEEREAQIYSELLEKRIRYT